MSRYIRLRGLPWSVKPEEIQDFLKGVEIIDGLDGIHLVKSKYDGKNTGEAFVLLASEKDEEEAFKHNKEILGHRYIEIFSASNEEAEHAMGKAMIKSNVVKLRGLPYHATEDMIRDFFKGLEIKRNRLLVCTDRRGRATGEAFVQFLTKEDTEQALKLNREKIEHRYIEIFRSTYGEMRRQTKNNTFDPYDRRERGGGRSSSDFGGRGSGRDKKLFVNLEIWAPNGGGSGYNNGGGRFNGSANNSGFGGGSGNGGFGSSGDFGGNRNNPFNEGSFNRNNSGGNFGGRGNSDAFCVHMRGLPYYCFENDVIRFFEPIRPVDVKIIYNNRGLHSGSADAYFDTHEEAMQALKKDREQMGNRYIELFYDGKVNKGGFPSRRI